MEKPSQAGLSILPTDYESLDIVAASGRLTERAELRVKEVEDLSYRILTNTFEIRTTRINAMVDDLLEQHRPRLLRSGISKRESLNQAKLSGKPAVAFALTSQGTQKYDALCKEISRMRT